MLSQDLREAIVLDKEYISATATFMFNNKTWTHLLCLLTLSFSLLWFEPVFDNL